MRQQLRHAGIVIGAYSVFFAWLFARPLAVEHGYIAETDLYEFFLPVFLSPVTTWSSFEFGGAPVFADPGEANAYPLHFLFARVIPSWTAFMASAFVIAACGAYAYVYSITRSRLAAAVAGLAYGLSETLVERIAHVATLHSMAWLPLMALAVDRLRGEHWRPWIAIGAVVLACGLLSGQPQVFIYAAYACALYALVGGVVERAGPRYYLAGMAMAGLAVLLAAIKALPVVETSLYTSRQTVNFGQFVGHANTPAQMLSLIIPAIDHEGREAPTYVGLITLLLAFVALRQIGNWRVAFWSMVTLIALLLGMGDATPLAHLAFEVPLYDKFRIVGRHLFLGAFGLAVLAGIGVAAIQRGTASIRVVAVAAVVFALVVGAAAATVVTMPEVFTLTSAGEIPWRVFAWDNTVWAQAAIALIAIVVTVLLCRRPRAAFVAASVVALLALDSIAAAVYHITPAGFAFEVLPTELAGPSVHALRLREALDGTHQRLLSPAGTHVDAVVPAAFGRLWRLPIAGGYGPMRLAHYADLATMQGNGAVEPLLLAHHNPALDLMAVKLVSIQESLLQPGPVIERHGVRWSEQPVSLPVGPPECGQRHARQASYALPPQASVVTVAMTARLRCSEDAVQGTPVATVKVIGNEATMTVPLRAGVEIADEGLSDPGLRQRARHGLAAVFDESAPRYSYVVTMDLPRALTGVRLEIALDGTSGSMEIDHLTAVTADGTALPQSTYGAMTSDTTRWRVVDRFSTSRRSDRGGDEALEGEEAYVVFENLRAMPRAWVVGDVLPIAARDRELALHYSLLPDGRPFTPATTALVDAGEPAARYQPGQSRARVREVRDGAITVDVTTERGGFLVLSESFYPGWRALVDGAAAAVRQTDGAFQGVVVPPGTHIVEFVFSSRALVWGQRSSAFGVVLALGLLCWRPRRRPTTSV